MMAEVNGLVSPPGGSRGFLVPLWDVEPWTDEQLRQIEQGKSAELGFPATVLRSVRVAGPMPTELDGVVVSTALQACQQAGISVVAGRDVITYHGGTNAAGQGLGLITVIVRLAPPVPTGPAIPPVPAGPVGPVGPAIPAGPTIPAGPLGSVAPAGLGFPPQGFPPAKAPVDPVKPKRWPLIAAIGVVVLALIVAGVFFIPRLLKGSSASLSARLATGYGNTCFVTDESGVKCWGLNDHGQLGNGTTVNSSTPVDVSGLSSGVVGIAAGGEYDEPAHVCALLKSGGVKCWGRNSDGQLGDGTTTDSATPVDVIGLTSKAVAIEIGGTHSCALMADGGVKCWGNNDDGQLGNGGSTDSGTPVDVNGLSSKAVTLSVGEEHTCVVLTEGDLKCWGHNGLGQLGKGDYTRVGTPVDVIGLSSGVTHMSAGGNHTCAVMTDGGVKCWGYNAHGQLGDGTTNTMETPVAVTGLSAKVAAVSAGEYHTCALTTDGGVKCWGYNYDGRLGNGASADSSVPVDVAGSSSGVAAVVAAAKHSCALMMEGGVKCWGDNTYGQLGDGTTDDSKVPVAVAIA